MHIYKLSTVYLCEFFTHWLSFSGKYCSHFTWWPLFLCFSRLEYPVSHADLFGYFVEMSALFMMVLTQTHTHTHSLTHSRTHSLNHKCKHSPKLPLFNTHIIQYSSWMNLIHHSAMLKGQRWVLMATLYSKLFHSWVMKRRRSTCPQITRSPLLR